MCVSFVCMLCVRVCMYAIAHKSYPRPTYNKIIQPAKPYLILREEKRTALQDGWTLPLELNMECPALLISKVT